METQIVITTTCAATSGEMELESLFQCGHGYQRWKHALIFMERFWRTKTRSWQDSVHVYEYIKNSIVVVRFIKVRLKLASCVSKIWVDRLSWGLLFNLIYGIPKDVYYTPFKLFCLLLWQNILYFVRDCRVKCPWSTLPHWGHNKMAAILRTTFPNSFSWYGNCTLI